MSNGGVLAATPLTVASGFMVNDVVGVGVLSIVAGVGLLLAARSTWFRKTNDDKLGV